MRFWMGILVLLHISFGVAEEKSSSLVGAGAVSASVLVSAKVSRSISQNSLQFNEGFLLGLSTSMATILEGGDSAVPSINHFRYRLVTLFLERAAEQSKLLSDFRLAIPLSSLFKRHQKNWDSIKENQTDFMAVTSRLMFSDFERVLSQISIAHNDRSFEIMGGKFARINRIREVLHNRNVKVIRLDSENIEGYLLGIAIAIETLGQLEYSEIESREKLQYLAEMMWDESQHIENALYRRAVQNVVFKIIWISNHHENELSRLPMWFSQTRQSVSNFNRYKIATGYQEKCEQIF